MVPHDEEALRPKLGRPPKAMSFEAARRQRPNYKLSKIPFHLIHVVNVYSHFSVNSIPSSLEFCHSPNARASRSSGVIRSFVARRRKKTLLPHFQVSTPRKKSVPSTKTMPHSQEIPVCLKTPWLITYYSVRIMIEK